MSDIVKRVQDLLKMPQELCKTCGKCCRLATFKGGLTYEEIIELINNPNEETSQVEGAKDFLTIFVPYASLEEAKQIDASFIEETLKVFGGNKVPSFFHCKFIGDNNLCKIHEDRPLLCRMYPIPHERTLYFSDCGFKETGIKNWDEIKKIMEELENKENS